MTREQQTPTVEQIQAAAIVLWEKGNERLGVQRDREIIGMYIDEAEAALLAAFAVSAVPPEGDGERVGATIWLCRECGYVSATRPPRAQCCSVRPHGDYSMHAVRVLSEGPGSVKQRLYDLRKFIVISRTIPPSERRYLAHELDVVRAALDASSSPSKPVPPEPTEVTGTMVEAACDSYLTNTGRVTEGAMEKAINAALAAAHTTDPEEDG